MSLRQGKLLLSILIKNKNIIPKPIGVVSSRNYVNTSLDGVKHLKLQANERVNMSMSIKALNTINMFICFLYFKIVD